MATKQKQRRGQIKAEQIRNTPNYPVQQLYPCFMQPGYVFWEVGAYALTSGIACYTDGAISFAKVLVPQMKMKTFRVFVHIDADHADTRFALRLFYQDLNGIPKDIMMQDVKPDSNPSVLWDVLSPAGVSDGLFGFDIPIEDVESVRGDSPGGWFTCSLAVRLLTTSTQAAEGHDALTKKLSALTPPDQAAPAPYLPVFIRGVHMEIRG